MSAAKETGDYKTVEEVKKSGKRSTVISGESEVYINNEAGYVIKSKDPYARRVTKGTYAEDAIFEHVIHNILFPDTRYEFLGIGGGDEEVRIILAQKYLRSTDMPTQDQIAAYIEKELGLQREDKYSWGNKYLSVTDVEAGSDKTRIIFSVPA